MPSRPCRRGLGLAALVALILISSFASCTTNSTTKATIVPANIVVGSGGIKVKLEDITGSSSGQYVITLKSSTGGSKVLSYPAGSGTDTADLSPGEWWVESATLNAQPIDLVAPDKNLAAVQRPNGSLIQTTFVIITKKATNSSRFITPVGLTIQ